MKRVIEKRILAFEEMQAICDLCKRWKGEFTEDDKRICKYNKDGKGLYSGLVIKFMHNYKCKYYKRNAKYNTCRLRGKNCRSSSQGVTKQITIKRGKVNIKIIDKNE